MPLRFCCICCEDKEEEFFLVMPANADGLCYWCDSCRLERYRELVTKNDYFGRFKAKRSGISVPKLPRQSYRQEPRPKPPRPPRTGPRKSYIPDWYIKPTRVSIKPVKEPKPPKEPKQPRIKSPRRYAPKKKYIPEPILFSPPIFTVSEW